MVVFWVVFNVAVLGILALDLGVFHRRTHKVGFKESLIWSAVWVLLAVGFAVFIWQWRGRPFALEFVTGYIIELSLSVDNLFVFLLIFSYFKVDSKHQHKVLFWGILGAIIMRAVFILVGVSIIRKFHWVVYIFGAFLVYTGIKLGIGGETQVEPEKNPFLKGLQRWFPMSDEYHGDRFVIRREGKTWVTPLLAVLLVVETTDLLFAVDSIPAILAITQDTFIVYTSNVFAILGLRSMYFTLSGLMSLFHYLKYGLAAILTFVGIKMLLSGEHTELFGIRLHYAIPVEIALGVVGGLLAISIIASVLFPPAAKASGETTP
jgi:tellurite resistance protein TerC